MARPRSRSPDSGSAPKKLKTSHSTDTNEDTVANFHPSLLKPENIKKLHDEYASSTPWLHSVVDELFQDDLLTKVKEECINELRFTEKETDIYKVSSLSYAYASTSS
jgi:prolyl 3-hydroxylase /prolyl 3,4-dihydroxylase